MALSSRQRAHLKSLAHSLKPVFQIGKEGVTSAVVQTVAEAFHNRELLKVKVLESAATDARAIGTELSAELGDVQLVQVIGRTLVLYRRHPDRPEIVLPR